MLSKLYLTFTIILQELVGGAIKPETEQNFAIVGKIGELII